MAERLDLNLLLAFEALMRERSVTRAAARLGLGQPATSAALSRLRLLFDDPLFVRTPAGMEPTARAEAIAGTVTEALSRLRAALEPADRFDAAQSRRAFTVSGVDYLGLVMLPRLVGALARDAPGVDLRFRFLEKDLLFDALDAGDVELAAAVLPEVPKHLATEPLIAESFVCVTCRDHPAAGGLTLADYAGYPHVLVTQKGDAVGVADAMLRERGLARRVAVTVPQLAIVPMLLPGTALIATLGRRAAAKLCAEGPFVLHEPPLALPPWRMDLVWSRRNDSDAGLVWLRARFHAAVTESEGAGRTAGDSAADSAAG